MGRVTLAEVDRRLARLVDQARRLPVTHPDYPGLHARIDVLLERHEQLRPLKPSDVRAWGRVST